MAAFSKYLTARNSSIAGSILFVLVLLKHRKRTRTSNRGGSDLVLNTERDGKKDRAAVDKVFFFRILRILRILVPRVFCMETGYLVFIAAMLVARTYCDVWMIQNGTMIESAIIGRSTKDFKISLLKFIEFMPIIALVNNFLKFGLNELKLRFREKLTKSLYNQYLEGFTYYKMGNLDNRIANADQLLTQDVEKFCNSVVDLYSNVSKPLLDIGLYIFKLTSAIGAQGPAIMMVYLLISGLFLTRLRRPVGKMTVTEQRYEGEYRYVNSRLITNSEEIAFYNGNTREKQTIHSIFQKLVDHLHDFIFFRFSMGVVDSMIAKYLATVVGYLVVSRPFLNLSHPRHMHSTHSELLEGPLEKSLQSSVAFERQKNMDNRVGIIRGSMQLMDQAVKYIEDMQDDFDFRYKTLQSRESTDRNSEMMKQEVTRLQEMLNRLDFKRKEILSKMDVVIKEIDDLMTSQLNPELQDWKRRQQIAAIGGPLLTGLEQLQSWFTLTAQSLFQIKRQLDKLGELVVKVTYESDPIPLQKPQMEERVKYLIYHLIKSSFVVEKQPCMPTHPQKPLIIKTGVQFTTKVRLLVKLPEVDYQLKVKTTFDKDLPPGRVSRQFFILTNNTKVMDIEDYSNGCLSVEFRHLQLKEKKYINGTKGNEGLLSVTEELHSLSFEACFTVQGLTIDLETCSLPLVVISNVSQLPGGWASVMWYNLLTDEPRNLAFFGNPPRASWSQLSEVLSWQFSTFAGRGLNKEQLTMLGEKLFGQHASFSDSQVQVSWSKFSKENIPGKPFSFWLWLDSILELIKKHLLPVWNENYIMGFVSKEMERALLKDKEPGTFLLRFSESHLGGITFTWVEHGDNGEVKFNSVEPYTKNRLSALPFADIIRDYKVISDGVVPENPLKFLYPDIPKDEAFGRLYNSQPSKVHPYIPSTLIPISEMRSNASTTPRSCQSPEPPMTPGEFDMLNEHLCFDIDTMSSPYSE